jgi:DNA-binding CsgD family transcriptional regulator
MSNSSAKLLRNIPTDPQIVAHAFNGPVTVVNADFDGDGKLDLAILDMSRGRIKLWMGDGPGGFRPAEDLPASDHWRADFGSPEQLTARETEVAKLVASGYMDSEIASILGIGRRTVETHAANIRAKLGLKSRRELVRRGGWPAA